MVEDDIPDEEEITDDELTEDELEAAYRMALEASEAAEETVAEVEAEKAAQDQPAASPASPDPAGNANDPPSLPPERIIEAALFVGGEPLSGRKLAHLLDLENGEDTIANIISAINDRYDRESRPYEVRHRESGYRMELRKEFEPVRDRLYGKAPKEVRLPPEVVAMLAVIAYEQPVGPERLGKLGIDSWKATLRQLTKRGLAEPSPEGYITTERFLDVFGLRALNEMPRPEGLAIK